MNVQSIAYQTDIGIRRLGGAQVEDCGDHLVVETPANRGFWWGNFILLATPPATRRRRAPARAVRADVPERRRIWRSESMG